MAVCDISSVLMPSWVEILLSVECTSVGGIMVSIAAFQAVDPGSIPGRYNKLIWILGKIWDQGSIKSLVQSEKKNMG